MIPLDDPIWKRLYGPYGIADVSAILRKLDQGWDDGLARDLIWEKLFHQETIYPVTYAALPYLTSLAQVFGNNSLLINCAFSSFLEVILRPLPLEVLKSRAEKYLGLSLQASDHHHSWIKPEDWLTVKDESILAQLEKDFETSLPELNSLIKNEFANTEPWYDEVYILAGGVAVMAGDFDLPENLVNYSNILHQGSVICRWCDVHFEYTLRDGVIYLPNGLTERPRDPVTRNKATQEILSLIPEEKESEIYQLVAALAELKTCPYCHKSLMH